MRVIHRGLGRYRERLGDVVVGVGPSVFELLAGEDEALLLVDFVEVERRHNKFLHGGRELKTEALRHWALVR